MPDKDQSSAAGEAEEKNDTGETATPDEGKGEGDTQDTEKGEKGGSDEVSISKKEYDHLKAVAERKSRKKDRASRPVTKPDSRANFSFEKEDEPDEDEIARRNEIEYHRFEKGLLRTVLKNKDYQRVIEQDKTLAKVLENNPASLLDSQPVDADDAIDQIVGYLDDRVAELTSEKSKKKSENKKEDSDQPDPTPPKKVEVDKTGKDEKRYTMDDLSKTIAGKVTVDGK